MHKCSFLNSCLISQSAWKQLSICLKSIEFNCPNYKTAIDEYINFSLSY